MRRLAHSTGHVITKLVGCYYGFSLCRAYCHRTSQSPWLSSAKWLCKALARDARARATTEQKWASAWTTTSIDHSLIHWK
jgi:hypothetical protein